MQYTRNKQNAPCSVLEATQEEQIQQYMHALPHIRRSQIYNNDNYHDVAPLPPSTLQK